MHQHGPAKILEGHTPPSARPCSTPPVATAASIEGPKPLIYADVCMLLGVVVGLQPRLLPRPVMDALERQCLIVGLCSNLTGRRTSSSVQVGLCGPRYRTATPPSRVIFHFHRSAVTVVQTPEVHGSRYKLDVFLDGSWQSLDVDVAKRRQFVLDVFFEQQQLDVLPVQHHLRQCTRAA